MDTLFNESCMNSIEISQYWTFVMNMQLENNLKKIILNHKYFELN